VPVIALVGNKGGAGKTTLAVNLAAALGRSDATAIIDADPQGSALQWSVIGETPTPDVFGCTDSLEGQAAALAERYRHVVIDCPPSVHAPQTHAALRSARLALVPVQPSPMDLWATVHIERAIEQARAVNDDLAALLVINQLEARTTLSRLIRDALGELDLPVATTAVRRRAVYRASALEGRSVFDMGRRGAAAAEELEQLTNEVLNR
jgi:chromosome partitioning protein